MSLAKNKRVRKMGIEKIPRMRNFGKNNKRFLLQTVLHLSKFFNALCFFFPNCTIYMFSLKILKQQKNKTREQKNNAYITCSWNLRLLHILEEY